MTSTAHSEPAPAPTDAIAWYNADSQALNQIAGCRHVHVAVRPGYLSLRAISPQNSLRSPFDLAYGLTYPLAGAPRYPFGYSCFQLTTPLRCIGLAPLPAAAQTVPDSFLHALTHDGQYLLERLRATFPVPLTGLLTAHRHDALHRLYYQVESHLGALPAKVFPWRLGLRGTGLYWLGDSCYPERLDIRLRPSANPHPNPDSTWLWRIGVAGRDPTRTPTRFIDATTVGTDAWHSLYGWLGYAPAERGA